MTRAKRLGLLALVFLFPAAQAEQFDYRLDPRRVADGVYVSIGKTEDFSVTNGGNIVNTGFIVGSQGVVVIDTGPSKRYGEQLRSAIARISSLPVALTVNTHLHPDHIFGNQAFPAETLAALPQTIRAIESEGADFLDNMYRLNGDWMRDTELRAPHRTLAPGRFVAGGRELELIALDGHSASDLAVLDRATGTLFAGDLVFNGRAPTTPHANLTRWVAALDGLERQPFSLLVPGHGEVSTDADPIRQTRRYLQWLDLSLRSGAEQGLDMTEMLELRVPPEFSSMALTDQEYRRSVSHLYPAAEQAALGQAR